MKKGTKEKRTRPGAVLRYYLKAATKYPATLALVIIGNLLIQGAGLGAPLPEFLKG